MFNRTDNRYPSRRRVEQVALGSGGGSHVLVRCASGQVLSCGSNFHGELGRVLPAHEAARRFSADFTPVAGLAKVSFVAARFGMSAAVNLDGVLWQWGLVGGYRTTNAAANSGGNSNGVLLPTIVRVPLPSSASAADESAGGSGNNNLAVKEVQLGKFHTVVLSTKRELHICTGGLHSAVECVVAIPVFAGLSVLLLLLLLLLLLY
jgi:hypothetical protein